MADERERITVKPRNQNAGEGGNLRGRGNSAGAGVRYTERPLSKAGPDCVGRVRVRESGTPPNLDEGPITPLRQAQQASCASGTDEGRMQLVWLSRERRISDHSSSGGAGSTLVCIQSGNVKLRHLGAIKSHFQHMAQWSR